jgi:alanine racemase
VSLKDASRLLSFLFSLDYLEVDGLYTHFSSADEPDKTPTQNPLTRFLDLANAFPTVKFLHTANSAATFRFPETHLNLVRVGISVYGLYPSSSTERTIPLKPVLSLKGRIVRIHRLKAGDGVGYGLTWMATNDALVALVPVGYGDGLPRLLSNRGEALVKGHRAPIRGKISMDQTVIEVTNIPGVKVGDEVTFIGEQPPEQITADDVAGWANTISYEILTALPSQLPRIYLSSPQNKQ